MEHLGEYIDYIAELIEAIGVLIIAGGSIFFLIRFLFSVVSMSGFTYTRLRHDLGKVILLGLEILVAADIIATVSTEPTMSSVLVLGVIVLIRTFLSFSIQLEVEGRLPWEKKRMDMEK
ncbi:MAG: DUF1622 domain-containing protein [Bacteroidota bacterium]